MNALKILLDYFGSGTAETELNFLDKAFVPHEDYLEIITLSPASPRLLVGKKGSGKSAFLKFFSIQMSEGGIPVLMLRPKDIALEINETTDTSLGSLTRIAEKALLKAIGIQIGAGKSGLLIKDEDKKLFQLAQEEGYKNEDTVQKILNILTPLGMSIKKIDFKKISSSIKGVKDNQIKESIQSSFANSQNLFYLLIDDTDQLASPDKPDHLNRIWAFLLATRSIMEECNNIKCIITLRNEVWKRLGRSEAGQRDQVDHFRNSIYFLNPDEESVRKIIEKRLLLAQDKLGNKTKYTDLYAPFFETERVIIPSTESEYRYWSDFIVKSSRERPRDAIQLVSMLAHDSKSKKNDTILSDNAKSILETYSEQRVDDLKREVDEECPEIKEIVRSFAGKKYDHGSFTFKPESAYNHLNKLPSNFSLKLFGKVLSPDKREDIFSLWRFLHEIGFLNARKSDTRMKHGYRHISSEEDPELVSISRWNDM